jgi:hypothetical protein
MPHKAPVFTRCSLGYACVSMHWTVSRSHLQVERLVLQKCLTYPSPKELKITS